MTSDHSHILSQLAAGDITADEAAVLLRGGPARLATGPTASRTAASPTAVNAAANRWLRVRVTDLQTGRQKVSVNLPLSWVSLGLKIGTRYAPEVGHLDMQEIVDALQAGTSGRIVDVEDLEDGQRVEIYIE